MPRGLWLVLALTVLSGCKTGKKRNCDAGECRSVMTVNRWDARAPQLLDLLVVVDPQVLAVDRARVRAGLADFAHELRQFPGTLDVQEAVVSSVLDAAGAPVNLLSGPCAPTGAPYLRDAPLTCGAPPNFAGSVEDALGCVGADAPDGPNQPLEVVRRVVGPDPVTDYRGFGRERAILLVVIISSRDDASSVANDPVALRAYLDALGVHAGVPFPLALSLVVPFTAPVDGGRTACALAGADVGSPPRLVALARELENRTAIIELCSGDWGQALGQLSYGPSKLVTCLPAGTLDRDPASAGLQPDCLGRLIDPAGQSSIELPPCGRGTKPCLNFSPDDICDGSGTSLSIDYDCYRPRGTEFELLCATEP